MKGLLDGKEVLPPSYETRVEAVLQQLRLAEAEKGERRAVLEMRTQYAGYFKGLYNFKPVRMQLMNALTIVECEDILHSYSIN